ncbi:MAG: cell division protein FtsA [Paracoccaceae bacterium]
MIAILDIGTSKIGCLVLRFDGPERFPAADGVGSLAGQPAFRVIGAATTRSRGLRFGEIDAMGETERAIRTAVQQAQKMAQTRVDHVIATFSGARPRSYGLAGSVDLIGATVTEDDVARALASCELPDIGAGREVLHRPAGQFRARPPVGPVGPARAGGQPAVGGHACAHRRCGRGAQRALLHPPLRSGSRGARKLGLCLGDFLAGRGRAGTGRGLYRHGRRLDRPLDLHQEAHDLRR